MRVQDMLELLLLAVIWGASFLFMRVATPEFGVIPLMELRLVIASLTLLPILIWRKGLPDLAAKKQQILTLGVFNSAIPFCLLAYATLTFSAGFTSIVNATVPLWAAIVALVWLKDKLSLGALLGLFIGFAGVATMAWDKTSFGQGDYLSSLIAGLIATLCYGICSVYSKARLSGTHSLALATGSLGGGALALLLPALYYWPENSISTRAWMALLAMSLLCTAFAYVLFFRLIANLGASRAVTVTYLIPLFSMALGAVFLNEAVTGQMLTGCAMILLGTALATGMLRRFIKKRFADTQVS